MHLTLIRKPSKDSYTEGELFLGEKKLCDTLEDVVRDIRNREDKVIGRTAIPKGTYLVDWTYSPKLRRYAPIIQEVPWYSGIRIHAGNTAYDTTGCILCGVKDTDGTLTMSKVTTERIYNLIAKAKIQGETVKITIS